MWLFDFKIFYLAGQAILSGISPYTVDGFYSPLPLAMVFVPFALFPLYISYGIYLLLSVYLLWKATGKRIFWVLLSFPVFFTLFVGQVDLQIALLFSLFGSYSLPLILAKPQLGFIFIPFLIRQHNWRKILKGGMMALGFLLLCFIVRPTWVSEWFSVLSTRVDYSHFDSSLYWLIPHQLKDKLVLFVSVLIFIMGFCFRDRRISWTLMQLFAPVTNIYSASVLAEWIGPAEVLASWLAMAWIGGEIHYGAPMYVVGIVIFLRYLPWGNLVLWWRSRQFNAKTG